MKTIKNYSNFLICSLIINIIFTGSSVSYGQPLREGQSVVSSYEASRNPVYNVLQIVDTRNIPPFISGGSHWTPNQFAGADWTFERMGNVFGIALDNASSPAIFVATSTIYCDQPIQNDSILIYRIDGVTWEVTNYIRKNYISGPPLSGTGTDWMPNTGSNIGNICYDKYHQQLFATNHEDGRIYCIRDNGSARGEVHSFYDPFDPNNDANAGFAPKGERLWGIGIYGTNENTVRVYFSRWRSDSYTSTNTGANEIWSVALTNTGEFISSSVRLEITLPILPPASSYTYNYSNPVSDIEFSSAGTMLLGERSMFGDMGACIDNPGSWAHRSRILEYPRGVDGLYTTYIWHKVGYEVYYPTLPFKCNSSGGVDFDYGFSDSTTISMDCDSTIVGTGDYLYPLDFGAVYGVQLTKRFTAGDLNQQNYSHFIDIYGDGNLYDKTTPGDVDVYRKVCEIISPVELMSLTFAVNSNNVTLNWITNSELNNSGFEIERLNIKSKLPDNWMTVGSVEGHGTITSQYNYEFTDRGLDPGTYNYRLKQIDFNGNYEYHNLNNEVVIGLPEKFELSQNYPNPFNPVTNLEFGISNLEFVSLKVYDITGKEVMTLINETKPAGRYQVKFDGSNLGSGVYFYKISAGSFTAVKRMLLIK